MCCMQDFGRYIEGQGPSMTMQEYRVRSITLLFEVGFYNYFTEIITILGWHVVRNILVATLKVKVTAWPYSKTVSGSLLCYLKSHFKTILQKWSPYWVVVSQATFGSLPWRSRSQHDLAAKTCLAYSFVFLNWILQLFDRKDYKWQKTGAYDNKKNTFWWTGRGLLYFPQYYQMLVIYDIEKTFLKQLSPIMKMCTSVLIYRHWF